ncbi:HlyD family efflux transporter periplasmic adaptor subunit [Streptomyces sp. SL13]|uniref:HlyD family efflux transporter periplasmic adaptor subunit n=1 Tax=Streptantibioticus silvisoli TaxID=2705255 RepID=A0AA90GYU6_9ACTN|nr:HlyD family efflux transporter periplasmic adaptor subunit [Streptantibioticus silvisoli]MDI5966226.1 HlyD family efflux transporter periplasmic adaptor subunit [Streptantibioticus silvisoli]MDI5968976.1 HlyD family efflux transporter periplasmic adaptor subunit [Streptantibioticus silvisoli]
MQFRHKALAKLQSPEELDVPVRFARPQGWLVLAVTVVLMAAGAWWAVAGTVTPRTTAAGALTHGEGGFTVQSPYPGQVTAVHAQLGATLPRGAAVLAVADAGRTYTVRMPATGRITTVGARIGAVVATGADLVTVERVDSPADPLLAVLYAPQDTAATIPAGAAVDLTVAGVPAHPGGTLSGTVVSVGRTPQSRTDISDFLGDPDLARVLDPGGAPVAVLVRLRRSTATRSGYAWSGGPGPSGAPQSGTPVSGSVHLAAQHPADWILP